MHMQRISPSTVQFFFNIVLNKIVSLSFYFLLISLFECIHHRLPGKGHSVAPQNEKKYIVFFSCLMELLEVCPRCTEPTTAEISKVVGTLIYVSRKCKSCSYSHVWKSQPTIRRIPAGNLLLSAAILYSGSMISQTLRMLKILKVECFSRQTYHKHQRNYLIPVVIKMWKEEQDKVIERMSNLEGGVVLSGDGRSDSPGHCAKYGAFTVIEQRVNKVLDIQLVQVSASCLLNDIFTSAVNTCHKYYVMSLCSLMKCETVPGASTKGFFVWNDFWLPKGFNWMLS